MIVECDVLIVGDSLGGCAAACQLGGLGFRTVMLSDHDWIGGQLTSQAVPPDEHPWIEEFGCTRGYRNLRDCIRQEYRREGLVPEAASNPHLNPGEGWVSRLCCSPRIAWQALTAMMPESVEIVRVRSLEADVEKAGGRVTSLVIDNTEYRASFVLDATETGTLLRDAEVEHVLGAEGRSVTGEPNALEKADPACFQAVTHCCALEWLPDEDFTIDKPDRYDDWVEFEPPHWSGKLFSWSYPDVQTGETRELHLFPEEGGGWFTYRQIVDPAIHDGFGFDHPTTMVNWPQNDFAGPCVCGAGPSLEGCRCSKGLTLAWIYWMQTEAGFTGLRLSGNHVGTEDGFAQEIYFRESRRICALETMKEQDVSAACHTGAVRAPSVENSIGVGAYRIDLHPRTNGQPTIDISALPYQIPLGALIPRHAENLLPACKNIGVTHVANGCTRLHPVEWNIGESAAVLAAYCIRENLTPQQVHASPDRTRDLQELMVRRGIEIDWPEDAPLHPL